MSNQYTLDPNGDIDKQLVAIGKQMRDSQNNVELEFAKSLDVKELNDAEFDSLVRATTGRPKFGDRSRLESAAKRQADAREAARQSQTT